MMGHAEFVELRNQMVEDFGVRSDLDNKIESEIDYDDDEMPWFECPICGEPILMEDTDEDWEILLRKHICPVCEEDFYND